ncbi:hypothetical protein [Pedobacter xixiisoli]|nr:hypothetical protein [Pedobacter xixiisoli]
MTEVRLFDYGGQVSRISAQINDQYPSTNNQTRHIIEPATFDYQPLTIYN